MGVKIDINEINLLKEETLYNEKEKEIGFLRSAIFSPTFNKVIGIAIVNKPYFKDHKF